MEVNRFYKTIVRPSLDWMAGALAIPNTAESSVLTMAIPGQESNWRYRVQIGGPARSYWQFEQGGGLAGLYRLVPTQLVKVCDWLDIPHDINTVFQAMAWNDNLACCCARLLLWTDPRPLPAVGAVDAAWQYYLSIWRPGMPHPQTWAGCYEKARAAVALDPPAPPAVG
jgi:hypothetical protein